MPAMPPPIGLPSVFVNIILGQGRRRKWDAGQTLIEAGERHPTVQVTLSGRYRASFHNIDGSERYLRNVLAHEVIGVPSALLGSPFPATLQCVEAGETVSVGRDAFVQLLGQHPELALLVIESLSMRLNELFDLLESSAFYSLRHKVLKSLQRLTLMHGATDAQGRRYIRITQADLARAVGASRQRVHLALKELETEGLLAQGYGRIVLLQDLEGRT